MKAVGSHSPLFGIVQSVHKPHISATQRAELPDSAELERLLDAALAEDLGAGDLTSDPLFPADAWASGRLVAKSPGVLAGLEVFGRTFTRLDPRVKLQALVDEGGRLEPGARVCELEGPARALLSGERTALNFVQRLSGIATLTSRFVAAAKGVRILDTVSYTHLTLPTNREV